MSINSEIIAALAPTGLTPVPTPYTGADKEYITFDYFTNPAGFTDDAPEEDVYGVYVRYYAPLKVSRLAKVEQIKSALFLAGFTRPSVQNLSDGDGQYWLFECEKAVYIGDD